ncbi:MAG: QueT transporter family protein [Erysipelotrichaceae bacterium]|nr:QueT transporter family protein [Erysipelotrichaceae bacterium]MBR6724120.1 QueT transporter family protein [Erysipelotrichaceae bacterium]
MENSRKSTLYIVQAALIAAIYVVLTLVFKPISFDFIQVRIAEALTILPMFLPAAVPGLFLGCLIANFFGGAVLWDVIFGSLATLVGAFFSYKLKENRWLVPVPPIVANVIVVPLVLKYAYGISEVPLLLMMVYIFVGEFVSCFILGELLASVLIKNHFSFFKENDR